MEGHGNELLSAINSREFLDKMNVLVIKEVGMECACSMYALKTKSG
jgi:hypothetical protein